MQNIMRMFVFAASLAMPLTALAENGLHIPRDKHGRIARSSSAKNTFKRAHPCPATGEPKGPCPGYVIDHIVALKRGGPDTAANMQWQTVAEAKAKDLWE
jgi:hypothetical protein